MRRLSNHCTSPHKVAVGSCGSRSAAEQIKVKVAGPGKCLLVTGPPGVGKSTLIMRVFENLRASNTNLKVQGFYTREIREGGDQVGFEVVTPDGRNSPLASSTVSTLELARWPSVGKYKVDIASFEAFALPVLQVPFLQSEILHLF